MAPEKCDPADFGWSLPCYNTSTAHPQRRKRHRLGETAPCENQQSLGMRAGRNWPSCDKHMKISNFLIIKYAGMAELADALDSGSSDFTVIQVQVLLPAPKHSNPNLLPIGETFGFVVYFWNLIHNSIAHQKRWYRPKICTTAYF